MIALAVDLGGTRLKLGVVRDGVVVEQRVVDARAHQGLEVQLPLVAAVLRQMCAAHDLVVSDCAALGLALPCLVEPGTGRILSAIDKYPDAPRLDLRDGDAVSQELWQRSIDVWAAGATAAELGGPGFVQPVELLRLRAGDRRRGEGAVGLALLPARRALQA